MNRSGYVDEVDDYWAYIRYCGARNKAIKGKRGQAFLKELLEVLEAMPEKKLIAEELVTTEGEVCALGAIACARNLDLTGVSVDDWDTISRKFNISKTLGREIAYMNDEAWDWGKGCTPEYRWESVRNWVKSEINE